MASGYSSSQGAPVQPDSRGAVLSAQIGLLYANTRVGVVVTVLAATVLAVLQWPVVPHHVVFGWWLYMILVSSARFILFLRHRRASPGATEIKGWSTAFTVGAGLAGAGWGGAGILLYPGTHLTNQVFLVFVLGGMMLGAASVLAPRPEAFLSFLIPTGLGPASRLFAEGDQTHTAMGLLAVVFILATLIMTWRIYRTIDTTLRLRLDNQSLLEGLAAAKGQTEALNQALEIKVRERTSELQRANERLLAEMEHRKKIEEELLRVGKLEAIGRLAGGVAHDFNNLMTIVVGYCESMRSLLANSSPLQKQVNEIHKAAEQANSLTRQLLAFSRRQELQLSLLDLNKVVLEMEDMLHRLVSDDVELTILADPSLGFLQGNRGQIEQVIMNLVINAEQAMPHGGRLVVSTTNVELDENSLGSLPDVKPGPFVRLAVSDTGIGMNAEVKARIFDPFFTTKEQGKGIGLGLTTVYGIVNQADGYIAVESEPEKGTTFRVYFPRAEGADTEADELPRYIERPTHGSETVLVVDDQKGLCTLLCETLRNQGYTVLPASNGQEALQVVSGRMGRIDLVITDMVMPQMGGRELAQALRTLHPQTKILYMTGYTDREEDFRELSHIGAFLEKPFTPETLLHKIRETLEG